MTGRIRTFKPDFFHSEEVAELSFAARLCFMGLWTQADRDGRLEDRPKRLKVKLFPYDDVDLEALITEMETAGLVKRYSVGEQSLIWIPKFRKHQRLNSKEDGTISKLPPHPEDDPIHTYGATGPQQGHNGAAPEPQLGSQERKGNRKGKEGGELGKSSNEDSLSGEPASPPAATKTSSVPVWVLGGTTEVIAHLNLTAKREFTIEAGEAKALRARLKDGGRESLDETVGLCKLVVDYHAAQWLHDPNMAQYLRPSTLFGPEKWESRTQNATEWHNRGRPPLAKGGPPLRVAKKESMGDMLANTMAALEEENRRAA